MYDWIITLRISPFFCWKMIYPKKKICTCFSSTCDSLTINSHLCMSLNYHHCWLKEKLCFIHFYRYCYFFFYFKNMAWLFFNLKISTTILFNTLGRLYYVTFTITNLDHSFVILCWNNSYSSIIVSCNILLHLSIILSDYIRHVFGLIEGVSYEVTSAQLDSLRYRV